MNANISLLSAVFEMRCSHRCIISTFINKRVTQIDKVNYFYIAEMLHYGMLTCSVLQNCSLFTLALISNLKTIYTCICLGMSETTPVLYT